MHLWAQSCPTLCDPMDTPRPTRCLCSWDLFIGKLDTYRHFIYWKSRLGGYVAILLKKPIWINTGVYASLTKHTTYVFLKRDSNIYFTWCRTFYFFWNLTFSSIKIHLHVWPSWYFSLKNIRQNLKGCYFLSDFLPHPHNIGANQFTSCISTLNKSFSQGFYSISFLGFHLPLLILPSLLEGHYKFLYFSCLIPGS